MQYTRVLKVCQCTPMGRDCTSGVSQVLWLQECTSALLVRPTHEESRWTMAGTVYHGGRNGRRGYGVLAPLLCVLWLLGCPGQAPVPSADRTGMRLPDTPAGISESQGKHTVATAQEQRVAVNNRRDTAAMEELARQDVYFALNSFALSDTAKATLEQKAAWLSAHPTVIVQIEGHCDEPGTEIYNLTLGERRADAVKRCLVDLGIAPWRLSTVSYGRQQPLVSGQDEAARSRNRRVHFVVTNP